MAVSTVSTVSNCEYSDGCQYMLGALIDPTTYTILITTAGSSTWTKALLKTQLVFEFEFSVERMQYGRGRLPLSTAAGLYM